MGFQLLRTQWLGKVSEIQQGITAFNQISVSNYSELSGSVKVTTGDGCATAACVLRVSNYSELSGSVKITSPTDVLKLPRGGFQLLRTQWLGKVFPDFLIPIAHDYVSNYSELSGSVKGSLAAVFCVTGSLVSNYSELSGSVKVTCGVIGFFTAIMLFPTTPNSVAR